MGNTSLRRSLETLLVTEGVQFSEEDYWAAQTALIEEGFIATGKGRGGSVKLVKLPENGFALQAPVAKPVDPEKPAKTKVPSVAPKVTGGIEPAIP